jgi:hypothetical protein
MPNQVFPPLTLENRDPRGRRAGKSQLRRVIKTDEESLSNFRCRNFNPILFLQERVTFANLPDGLDERTRSIKKDSSDRHRLGQLPDPRVDCN